MQVASCRLVDPAVGFQEFKHILDKALLGDNANGLYLWRLVRGLCISCGNRAQQKIHKLLGLETQDLHAHKWETALVFGYVTGIAPFWFSTTSGRSVTSMSCLTTSGLALSNVLKESLFDLTSETMSDIPRSSSAVSVGRLKISLKSILGLEPEENSFLSLNPVYVPSILLISYYFSI